MKKGFTAYQTGLPQPVNPCMGKETDVTPRHITQSSFPGAPSAALLRFLKSGQTLKN